MKINFTWSTLLLFSLLILLLIMQQTLKVGGNTLLSSGIHNSAHGPWFALVTYLIWRILSTSSFNKFNFSGRLSLTIMIAIFIAFLSEFGEKVIGREASWEDFFLDMLGMISTLLFVLSCRPRKDETLKRKNSVLISIGCLFLFISLYPFIFSAVITLHHKNSPTLLLGFNSYQEYATITTNGESQIISAPESWLKYDGQKVMKIIFSEGKWPGFKLKTITSNWDSYSYLIIEIFNDSDLPLPLSLSIRPDSLTDEGTVNFIQRLQLLPGANTLRVSIDDLLPHRENIEWLVRYLNIYTPRSFARRTVYLKEIRLE